jgi:sulfite reductase (NADPH) hemoprotein beta-component
MKFLMKALGWERWRDEFEHALAEFRAEGGARLPFDPERPPTEDAPLWRRPAAPSVEEAAERATSGKLVGPGIHPDVRPFIPVMDGDFAHWLRTNVRPQKQSGYVVVTATVPLGDVTSEQMRVLADLALAYGDGAVRVTHEQDLVFRWVPREDVPELYRRLAAAGLGLPDANTIADVTSCPGAESCRLAVTQSRGLGRVLSEHLGARPALVATAPDLKIKISGCPNGCGQHHIATIGFQGSLRKVDGKAVPQYFIQVGGGIDAERTTFARLAAKVPARRAAAALERLVRLYGDEKQPGETPVAFFRRLEVPKVKALLSDLETFSSETASDSDYIDLAETTAFRPETTEGECAT